MFDISGQGRERPVEDPAWQRPLIDEMNGPWLRLFISRMDRRDEEQLFEAAVKDGAMDPACQHEIAAMPMDKPQAGGDAPQGPNEPAACLCANNLKHSRSPQSFSRSALG